MTGKFKRASELMGWIAVLAFGVFGILRYVLFEATDLKHQFVQFLTK